MAETTIHLSKVAKKISEKVQSRMKRKEKPPRLGVHRYG